MLKVTCAIIVHQGKILATQRGADSDHPFQWEFPGGKIDSGETAEESIIREIWEELEIKIRILKKMQSVKWDYGFKKIELIPFLCLIESGKINLTEHHNLTWTELNFLNDLDFSDADRELITLQANRNILVEYFRENMDNSGKNGSPAHN